MTNDLLTIAQSREEQLTIALTESVAGLTSISIDAAADVSALLGTNYIAHATGGAAEFYILASESDLTNLANGESNGPAAVLQRLAVSVTSAIVESEESPSGTIEISSPGEIAIENGKELDWTAITIAVGEGSHLLHIAIMARDEQASGGLNLPEFAQAAKQARGAGKATGSLGLLADIEVDVTVELGRRRLPINELLMLTRGSIIELSKLVGEPLEVYVNNRLIADGEAVVIDEQFGIRITNIVPSAQRSFSS